MQDLTHVCTSASADIKVGDILRIYQGQEFPADLVLLSSSNADGTCSVNTANLDGEAVPKIRSSADTVRHILDAGQLRTLKG
jgi:P-type E1-E2 ATPase